MNTGHGQAVSLLLAVMLGALGVDVTPVIAQSEDGIAKQFVGMWRLVSTSVHRADGTSRPSRLSVGYIIYTDTNRMCAALMDPARPKWSTASPYANTTSESEALSAITGFDGYCSTIEVHAKEGFVVHNVEVAIRPNLVSKPRKRWFKFDGPNRVTLRVDPAELSPPVTEFSLTWERVVN
jgi:Lipocalin-like domain